MISKIKSFTESDTSKLTFLDLFQLLHDYS